MGCLLFRQPIFIGDAVNQIATTFDIFILIHSIILLIANPKHCETNHLLTRSSYSKPCNMVLDVQVCFPCFGIHRPNGLFNPHQGARLFQRIRVNTPQQGLEHSQIPRYPHHLWAGYGAASPTGGQYGAAYQRQLHPVCWSEKT